MILILSDESDQSTCDIIDYLIRDKISFIRVNDTDKVMKCVFELNENGSQATLEYQSFKVRTSLLSAFWYRRGAISINRYSVTASLGDILKADINRFLDKEDRSIFNAINLILEGIPIRIGAFSKHNLEKLTQLYFANICDISVPSSIICTEKAQLVEFQKKFSIVATKGITNNFYSSNTLGQGYFMYTSIIDEEKVNEISDTFSPTLFQEYISKRYELRIFYLKGEFFSMAIFSQSNSKTKIDFRNYDWNNPNRTTPFKLPFDIEEKLSRLMDYLSLDTGSIDMIVTLEGEYVFLEVNPDGQFGMVSYPCNYHLEKRIACFLSKSSYDKNQTA